MNDEIVELQTRLAFQEDTILELSDALARQQAEIRDLTDKLQLVQRQVRDLMQINTGAPPSGAEPLLRTIKSCGVSDTRDSAHVPPSPVPAHGRDSRRDGSHGQG